MKHRTLSACVVVFILFFVRMPANAEGPSLLGSGAGVDHVMEGVRDMPQAANDFSKLGFAVGPGGHFPDGMYNQIIRFENRGYLELLSLLPAPHQDPEMVKFLAKHDGALGLGLNVSPAAATAAFLRSRNFDVQGPDPGSIMKAGDSTPPPPQWYTVSTQDKPASGKRKINLPVFFIDYLNTAARQAPPKNTSHPNTAKRLAVVWFAVHDPRIEQENLIAAGFAPAGKLRLMDLEGMAFHAGTGTLVLLGKTAQPTAVDSYLKDYEDGIIALSIEVSDLTKAKEIADKASGLSLPVYRGSLGQSFLLPAAMTHGLRVELFSK